MDFSHSVSQDILSCRVYFIALSVAVTDWYASRIVARVLGSQNVLRFIAISSIALLQFHVHKSTCFANSVVRELPCDIWPATSSLLLHNKFVD